MKTFEELKVNLQEQDEPMMRVIMLGGPGSGKSTYSKFITKHFQIPHVYTGDMMRSLAQQDTDIGKKVKSALDKGDYVDTKIVLDTLEARLQRKETNRGYVVDGFPRSMQQVREMERRNIGYDHVVFLDVAEDEVVRRLTSRGRADDKPDIIKNRIAVYKRETMPVIKHFENKMLNIRVEGGEQIEDVAANIIDRLEAADEDF